MHDNGTTKTDEIISTMKNLFEQASKVQTMLGIIAMLNPKDEAPPMALTMHGVGKGTEATIYSMFFRLFHEHDNRDALLAEVGLDRVVYMETATKVQELRKRGESPDVMDIFKQESSGIH